MLCRISSVLISAIAVACVLSGCGKPSNPAIDQPAPKLPAANESKGSLNGSSTATRSQPTVALQSVLDELQPPKSDFTPVQPSSESGKFELLDELKHDKQEIVALVFSGDARRLVAATSKGSLTVWNVPSKREEKRLPLGADAPVAAVDVSFDGKQALVGVGERAELWDLESGKVVHKLQGHPGPVLAVALSRDGRLACTAVSGQGNKAGRREIWDLRDGSLLIHPQSAYQGRGALLQFSADCRSIVSDRFESSVTLEELPSGRPLQTSGGKQHLGLQSAWINDDATLLLDANVDGTVTVKRQVPKDAAQQMHPMQRGYDSQTVGSLESPAKVIRGVPGNGYFVVYGGGSQLDYRRLPSLELAGRYPDQVKDVTRAAVSADGQFCASSYQNGNVRIWKLPPPTLTTKQRQLEDARQISKLLREQQFDALEEAHRKAIAASGYYADGSSKLVTFYRGLVLPDAAVNQTESQVAELREALLKAKPDSVAVRVAIADVSLGIGLRETMKIKVKLSKEEAEKLPWYRSLRQVPEVLAEARKLAEQQNLKDPQVYASSMHAAITMTQPKEQVQEFCKQGLAIDPTYLPLLTEYGDYITPCKNGVVGEGAEFATTSAAGTSSEEDALQVYAAVGSAISCGGRPTEFGVNGFSVPKLRRGAALLMERYPESSLFTHFACMLACIDSDKPKAKELMQRTGSIPAITIWRSTGVFEKYRKWAFSEGATEAKFAVKAHSYPVTDLAWSHDGKFIVTSSSDQNGRVKIWDASAGKLLHTLSIDDIVYSIAISPDDQTLAVAGGDGSALFELWDLKSNSLKRTAPGFKQPIRSCRFSSLGDLAGGGDDLELRMWSQDEAKQPFANKSADAITTVCFSPDGRFLATGGKMSQVQLFDVAAQSKLAHIVPPCTQIRNSAMSSDVLAVVGGDGRLELIDLKTHKASSFGEGSYASVAISKSGRLLALGKSTLDKFHVELWDREVAKKLHVFEGHVGIVSNVQFSSDERALVSAGHDGMLCVWDISSFQSPTPAAQPLVDSASPGKSRLVNSPVNNIAPPGGNNAPAPAAAWRIGELRPLALANLSAPKVNNDDSAPTVMKELKHDGQAVLHAKYLEDAKQLLTATADGTLSIWDVEVGNRIKQFSKLTSDAIHALDVSADGSMAIGAVGKAAKVWSLDDGRLIAELKGHSGDVTCVAFGRDSRVATTGSRDGTLRLWEVANGKSLDPSERKPHAAAWTSVQFSPDMKYRIAGAEDGSVAIESMPGRELRFLEYAPKQSSPIQEVAVSSDGVYFSVLTRSGASINYLMNETSLSPRNPTTYNSALFSAPPSAKKCLSWFPGNKHLAIYSGAGQCDLWHPGSGGLAGRWLDSTKEVNCVTVSPDGRAVASGYANGTVRIWNLPGPKLTALGYQAGARKQLREMLAKQQYDQLNKVHAEILRKRRYIGFGEAECELYYQWLSWSQRFDRRTDPTGEKLIAELTQWANAQPERSDPQIAIALTHLTLAEKERKEVERLRDAGQTASPGDDHLAAASQALAQAETLAAKQETPDPMLYCIAGQAASALKSSTEATLAIYQQGLKIDPLCMPIIQRAAALLRDAGEKDNSVSAFADSVSSAAPNAQAGLVAYAAAGVGLLEFKRQVDFRALGFSIPRLRQGVELLRKRSPRSTLFEQFACLLACNERDRNVAEPLFELIGSRPESAVWTNAEYERIRRVITSNEKDESAQLIDTGIYAMDTVSISADGTRCIVHKQGCDRELSLFKDTFKSPAEAIRVDGKISCAAISRAGDLLGVGIDNDGSFRFELWDLDKRELKKSQWMRERCTNCCFTSDQQIAIVTDRNIKLYELDLATVRQTFAMIVQQLEFKSVSVSPQGKYLTYEGPGPIPTVYDLTNLKNLKKINPPPYVKNKSQSLVGDINGVAVGHADSIYVQEIDDPQADPTTLRDSDPKSRNQITALALSGDESLLAAGHMDESGRVGLEIWNIDSGKKSMLRGHTGPIRHMKFLTNTKLATAADDGTIRVWNATGN